MPAFRPILNNPKNSLFMIDRIACFSTKTEITAFFGETTRSESLFEPHYNIAPAHHLLAVRRPLQGGLRYERSRWGWSVENERVVNHLFQIEEASGLQGRDIVRCMIPISGFYLWKKGGDRAEYPFFVRLLEEPLMAVCGMGRLNSGGASMKAVAMITTGASAMIQPLSDQMPLFLDQELAETWLAGGETLSDFTKEASARFRLSDMSVLRVSDKVNDLNRNSPELIQPLPK